MRRSDARAFRRVAALALLALGAACGPRETSLPPSVVLTGLEFDFDRAVSLAPGSDNWPVTWAADGEQFTAWGDGGGFGGTDGKGRVSLGVGRIEGDHPDFTVRNVWGGVEAEAAATFQGKTYALLAVGKRLWMWVTPGSDTDGYKEARLAWSDDDGRSWSRADWAVDGATGLVKPAFLQFGAGYADARDDHVYAYFIERRGQPMRLAVHRPGAIHLLRAPRERLAERDAWSAFAGTAEDGETAWTETLSESRPVFTDERGVGWNVSVSYAKGISRYVLCTEHHQSFRGNLGFYDAPTPWGPWHSIAQYDGWGPPDADPQWFYGNFSNRWADGDEFVFIATGIGSCDRWLSVPGRFLYGER